MDLNLSGKVAVVTGGGGAICGAIARALAREGARVAVWDISRDAAEAQERTIRAAGGDAAGIAVDVTEKHAVDQAVRETLKRFQGIDILVNGAGGSRKEATTAPDLSFFDMDPSQMRRVMDLNYMSAVVCSQAVARVFAEKKRGVILNITSIAGMTPLTRSVSYSNGKAASNSFTQWLAVHMATTYSPAIRVNAIAPGFMLTEQNRFLLVDEKTGAATERAVQVLKHVPLGRLGEPEEIVGAALWLVSDSAKFVTGAVVPVDGGFSAFPGV
jgi:NAD(P)-dependent dehydrogenase (short-subunit alcohol dehydrogenase family)